MDAPASLGEARSISRGEERSMTARWGRGDDLSGAQVTGHRSAGGHSPGRRSEPDVKKYTDTHALYHRQY